MDAADNAKNFEQLRRKIALDNHKNSVIEPPQDVVDGVVYCIDCGVQISANRLAAKPNAARCIDCQEIYETRERQRGH